MIRRPEHEAPPDAAAARLGRVVRVRRGGAVGLVGGALAKKAGQAVEKKTGRPVHKVGSPLAAIASSTIAAQALPPEWMTSVCDLAGKICDSPGIVLGLVAVLAHVFGGGVAKAFFTRE